MSMLLFDSRNPQRLMCRYFVDAQLESQRLAAATQALYTGRPVMPWHRWKAVIWHSAVNWMGAAFVRQHIP
jgi:hypothetical protein